MKGRKIFISYRRDDAKADARSIYQHLERRFGAKSLFMDVDSIERGLDFREAIEADLADSVVMLAVIGPSWLSPGDDRRGPLDDPNNFVRMEIASALRRKIPVIPVLVGGAQMPDESDLPEDIRELVFRQAARVNHENFSGDMRPIERDLNKLIRRSRRWPWALIAALVLLTGVGVALFQLDGSSPVTKPATERAFTSFEENIDRPGGDYTSHRLAESDPLLCQRLCAEDQRCLAWTYVKPGYQESTSAICWLKNEIPQATRRDVCCVSGVTYYRRPKK